MLDRLVSKVETCIIMHELGWKKKTVLWWRNDYPSNPKKYKNIWGVISDYDYPYTDEHKTIKYDTGYHLLVAPTAQEIDGELPILLRINGIPAILRYQSANYEGGVREHEVWYGEISVPDKIVEGTYFKVEWNEAEARAQLWIYLKTNKLI